MIDPKIIREHIDILDRALAQRQTTFDTGKLKEIDEKRRSLIQETEKLKNEKNVLSNEIAKLKRSGEDASDKIEYQRSLGQKIDMYGRELRAAEDEWEALALIIPNIPDGSVPVGASDEDNKVVKTWGEKPAFDFEPKAHWDLGEDLDILDPKRAVKITGSRFALYKSHGALLERALINFMLDLHIREHGYTEVLPPFMVNRTSMTGTGQLPKFEEELFHLDGVDYFLIPTAEVPVTNIHADEILKEEQLPVKYVSYTPCFRKEAGAHGKDTRGLTRLHQFNKVELVKFAHPDNSFDELEGLLLDAEDVLKRLDIHYRVSALCTGDLGFSSAKTYDIEVWLPGQEIYREISSCSCFTDFQARRAKIRFRRQGGKTELVHTLNGSGLAIGRTVMAVMENYQNTDGTINIPDALKPYMHGLDRITR
ncbi:MAG: serine--tRNA ligase [Syntrophorhabdaceae bacterium]|nr:serine--tRNA ligase [Syntrophorhabdaceae bacterium]MDD4195761.1 serine--tRNA ligase [Syntrophorhabdaceae bacterium]HOC45233.1 serine--tRNA ligase [Syntrophorhabdaceae bacterium]